jgi:hypothetical protein
MTKTRGRPEGLALDAMGVALPLDQGGHPNASPFEGVLTRLDEPSDKAPSGADGHRVCIPRATAEAALPTLIGMAVDFRSDFKGHDSRAKCGVITEAWIDGQDLLVRGHLYARDFAAEVAQMRQLSRAQRLGLSFEITEVTVDDIRAAVWELCQLTFTGAAILERASAAYEQTRLIAAQRQEDVMPFSALTQQLSAVSEQLDGMRSTLATFTVPAVSAAATPDAPAVSTAVSATIDAQALPAMQYSMERMAQAMGSLTMMYDAMAAMEACVRGLSPSFDAMGAVSAAPALDVSAFRSSSRSSPAWSKRWANCSRTPPSSSRAW